MGDGELNLLSQPLNSSTPRMSLLARYGKKRTTLWVGYKVHCTQTCDEEAPQLITHVETTPAPISDEGVLSTIHTDLAEKDLLAIRNISLMRAMSRVLISSRRK